MAKKPTRSEEEHYRIHFFIVASLIMGSMVWLLYQEFFTRRPWKDHQIAYFQIEKARAELGIESEKRFLAEGTTTVKDDEGEEEEIDVGAKYKELQETVAKLEGGIRNSPQRGELERLKPQLKEAEIAVKDGEIQVAFAKAAEDEFYYYYRNAKHHDDEKGEGTYGKRVAELQADVAARSKEYDKAVAVRDGLSDKINAIRKEVSDAKREITKLESGLTAAQRASEAADERYPDMLQHWNQDIELVDRCHNCHMGSDRCGFTAPEEILDDAVASGEDPEVLAPKLRKKYCITREEAEAYASAAEEVRDSFGEDEELDFAAVKDKLLLDKNPVLATAKKLGMDPTEAEQLFRTHPNRTGLIRNHPGGKFGCTTCHYGQGRQTKGVALNLLKGDTAPFTHARRDHYWVSQILENKDHHTEASCYNCHKNDYELEYAPNLNEARKTIQHLGCTGCHPLGGLDSERKHGPTLTKVASKIDTGWLAAWITDPHEIRPRTRMPNFWPEVGRETPPGERELVCNKFDYARGAAVSPAETEDCVEKRDREVGYITAYLVDKSKATTYPSQPGWADAAKGQELFESIGCQACHNMGAWEGASTMPGDPDRDIAPNLSGVGDKVKDPGWFYTWVKNPKDYWHETRMPSLRLTDEEAWHMSAYLQTARSGKKYDLAPGVKAAMEQPDAIKKGEALIAWYGCYGCHDIEGYDNRSRIGVDLTDFGSKPTAKLDFGDIPEFVSDHHAQTWDAWLRRKLHDPRGYRYERVETRMPQFDLTKREINALVLFLRGSNLETEGWPQDIRKQHTKDEAAVQRGAYLVDIYNCRGCHQIDERGIDVDGDRVADGGDIYKLFADNEAEKYRAPPKLVGLGRKLYPDWLYGFLKEPFKLRENFKVRMPTFQFDDRTAAELVAYFSAKSKVEYPYVEKTVPKLSADEEKVAAELFAAAQCLNCHNLGGKVTDPKNIAPNLKLTAERLRYEWLFDWLKDPSRQIPGVAMPGFFVYDEDTGEYSTGLPQAGGDWKKQVDLLRAYVIAIGAQAEKGEASRGSQ